MNTLLTGLEYYVELTGLCCYLPDLWWERKKYGIYVDENIFDNPLWSYDTEIFYKVHPFIDKSCIEKIEEKNQDNLFSDS